MKILIASDSHGNNEALDILFKKYKDVDLFLHAGDSESDELRIHPFLSVRGNCDYFSFPESRLLEFPFGNIFITHKPYISVKELKDKNVKFFISGHTHVRKNEYYNGIYFINPGAITHARDGNYNSYAILDINNDKVCINFYTL